MRICSLAFAELYVLGLGLSDAEKNHENDENEPLQCLVAWSSCRLTLMGL